MFNSHNEGFSDMYFPLFEIFEELLSFQLLISSYTFANALVAND